MTTTSVSSDIPPNYLSNYNSSSSLHTFARRHSIYGTEDRVVLDIGSLYIKCGFSGESHPRHIVPTCARLERSSGPDGEAYSIDTEVRLFFIIHFYSIYLSIFFLLCCLIYLY